MGLGIRLDQMRGTMMTESEIAGSRAPDAMPSGPTSKFGRSIAGFSAWRGASLLLFAASFLILLFLMDLRIGNFDEGILLTGAQNVLSGAVPHRDFYANYGPADFYILAALFDLFGTSSTVARYYDILIRAAIVAMTFAILAPRCRPTTALAAACICLGWMLGSRFYLYPVFPTLLLALVGTQLLSVGGRIATGRLLGAGAATGLTALFRYDVGFLLMAAHLLFFGFLWLTQESRAGGRTAEAVRQTFIYGLGIGIIFVPPALLLVSAGALPGFIGDIVDYPSKYYVAYRGLPFPGPAVLATAAGAPEAAVYLPFGAVVVAAWAWFRDRGSRSGSGSLETADSNFLVAFGLATLFLTVKGLVRITTIHMMIALVPALLLIAFVIDRRTGRFSGARIFASLLGLVAAGTAVLQAAAIGYLFMGDPGRSYAGSVIGIPDRPGGMVAPSSPAVSGARLPADAVCAAEFVRSRSAVGEPIFVASGRHDKLIANRVELYFASGRRPGTHWYQFDPGLQTRADVQAQIISDLQRNRVRWVIRDRSYDGMREPNRSAISSGVRLLDQHLAANYTPVAVFGAMSVWSARGLPVVPGASNRCGGAPVPAGVG
jgi:hypothetical protein